MTRLTLEKMLYICFINPQGGFPSEHRHQALNNPHHQRVSTGRTLPMLYNVCTILNMTCQTHKSASENMISSNSWIKTTKKKTVLFHTEEDEAMTMLFIQHNTEFFCVVLYIHLWAKPRLFFLDQTNPLAYLLCLVPFVHLWRM